MKLNKTISTLCLAGLLALSAHAAPIFTLNPSGGALSGADGSTVGWGFTLTNTTDYLLVTGVSFTPTPLSSFGTFEDYLSTGLNLIVVGPSPETPTLTETFNSVTRQGAGAFHIATTAAGSISGTVVLEYSLFSVSPNSPNFDPDTDTLLPDATLSAAASVSTIPEPQSMAMVAIGCLGLVIALRRGRPAERR